MNYYSVLGVPKNASDKDIKTAFRRLAKEHHPDRTGGDDTRFKQINEAYDTLKDPDKRSMYDNPQRQNSYNFNSQNVNDIFSSFFGNMQQRQRRNANIGLSVKVSLEDIAAVTTFSAPPTFVLTHSNGLYSAVGTILVAAACTT